MIKSKISGIEKAQKKIKKEMEKMSPKKYVMVGLNEGLGQHSNSDLSIVEVGAINQFGGGNTPARPWLDTGVEDASEEIQKIVDKAYQKENFDEDSMLELIGISAVNHVQKKITDIKTPPNSPATIKEKGSSNPLIDTGEMRSSVTYIVTSDKPEVGI